ncbi:hypothetical protein ACFYOT_10400 [Saccharothrix saharensis]|uniref:hypothetical protein n=1 Tax=Saccharothrix saharensis TaxID=571190 RepID=UPI003699B548
MRIGSATGLIVAVLVVGGVPSAVVAVQPVAPVAEPASSRVDNGPLPHLWADGQRPGSSRASSESAAEPVVPVVEVVAEPVPELPTVPQQAVPQPAAGLPPSDGLSVAERNNRVATPRPPMEQTLPEPPRTPPVVIPNDPSPAPQPEEPVTP